MTVKIFDTPEVQGFLKTVAGFDQEGGNERAKQIMHRLLSDLFKLIDDFDVSEEEYWSAVNLLNALGSQTQFGLLSPRSEEHTSELQSRPHLVCRLLLEK